jgi:predicted 2-oxoglutarate/Fe(II)-dependent dioxygenase YbiX
LFFLWSALQKSSQNRQIQMKHFIFFKAKLHLTLPKPEFLAFHDLQEQIFFADENVPSSQNSNSWQTKIGVSLTCTTKNLSKIISP